MANSLPASWRMSPEKVTPRIYANPARSDFAHEESDQKRARIESESRILTSVMKKKQFLAAAILAIITVATFAKLTTAVPASSVNAPFTAALRPQADPPASRTHKKHGRKHPVDATAAATPSVSAAK